MFKVFLFLVIFLGNIFALDNPPGVDCIILEDENSIICKYTHKRLNHDINVTFNWIEPDGTITRKRELNIPAGHGSVYDYRYIRGRTHGVWTMQVLDGDKEYKTNFTLK